MEIRVDLSFVFQWKWSTFRIFSEFHSIFIDYSKGFQPCSALFTFLTYAPGFLRFWAPPVDPDTSKFLKRLLSLDTNSESRKWKSGSIWALFSNGNEALSRIFSEFHLIFIDYLKNFQPCSTLFAFLAYAPRFLRFRAPPVDPDPFNKFSRFQRFLALFPALINFKSFLKRIKNLLISFRL